ncbi:MAG: tetratricopeptide repeat protein [Desulfobulbus sp.]|nr:tetratricopeptide repeat protein [Desulfobulbus sp.]
MKSNRLSFLAAFSSFLLCSMLLAGCFGEKNKEEHYQKAMSYLQAQKDKEAIIELRNAIQIDPKYAQARYQLGLLYLKSGDPRQAFEELQRAATLDPKNLDASIKTAEFYLLGQKKNEARSEIEKVLKQAPDNKDGLALLANLELIDGKADSALTAIDKAIAASPNEDRMYIIKGRILSAKGQFAEAEQAFMKALELDGKKTINFATLAAFYVERKELDKARATLDKMAAALPDSPQPYLQMASIDLRENDVDKAEQHFQQALKLDPKNSKLKAAVANFYLMKGSLDQAEQMYKDAVASADKPEEFEAQLANFYFDYGKFDQAKEMLAKVTKANSKNASAILVNAKFLLKDGKNQEALDMVNNLIRDYPKWGELYFVKAVAHSNLKDMKLAKEALLESIRLSPELAKAHSLFAFLALQEGEFETAKKEATIALKINPRDFQAAMILAKGVLFTKDYSTAEKMFAELNAKIPDNVEILGSLGLAYIGLQQEPKAKQTFDKVMALQPDNVKAFAFLLQIAQKGGAKQEELIKMTEAQMAKAPKSGGMHILLANQYLNAKQQDKALELYQKAQELEPDNPQSYAMSAMILSRQGKTDQAIAELKDLVAKRPKSLGAHMGLGSLYEQSGKIDLAKESYAKALEIKPDFAPAANNLAWLIAEGKDPDLGEALRLAMIAKQQQPDDVHIIDTLGWVHYKRGSFGLARNEFMQAVQKQDNMPVIRYHLALALYGEGKKQEAIKELEKALSQNQPFKEKDEAEATLKKWRGEQ